MGNKDKKKRREKLIQKERNLRHNQPTQTHGSAPTRFTNNYGGPDGLRACGPLCLGQWHIPPILAQKLHEAGRIVPPPVNGQMLIDTGADSTCIALDVAQELGLRPMGFVNGYGAGGLHKNGIYHALLTIGISDANGTTTISMEERVQAIPNLGDHFKSRGDIKMNGAPVRLIGLLGRDFLQHTRFVYHGSTGLIEVTLQTHTIARRPPVLLSAPTGIPTPPAVPSSTDTDPQAPLSPGSTPDGNSSTTAPDNSAPPHPDSSGPI